MKVKLEDVAREAGVSIATVSRVLNNHSVSFKARENVEEAIAKLDYRPNLTARGLIKGKSCRIGVIVSNMENPYFSSIMNSMEIRLREEGYLCNFSSTAPKGNVEIDILRQYLDSGVDGLIVVDVEAKSENSGLYADLNRQIPVVLINGNPDRTDTNLIMMDQEKGMEQVLEHLFSLNHRNIGFLRGAAQSISFDCKEKVFRRMMAEKGCSVRENLILRMDDTDHFNTVNQTCELFFELLELPERPSAVFASNELMGLGVLKAARQKGLRVPEDLSLVAQDNTILSRISEPAMTTINMNPPRLGIESAEMMLQLLHTENPSPRRLVFYPELIIRNTSGTAPE